MRPNDIWSILCSAAYASPQSRDMVWEFVKDNWTVLKERYQGTFLLGRIVDVSSTYYMDAFSSNSICTVLLTLSAHAQRGLQ